mmetsp:Transcript_42827/g.118366  ORF Transcript_42827/g.118366 Transcript_42827/m.118366 type:complete len:338 (+) Transcript_42827:917-1930(+)
MVTTSVSSCFVGCSRNCFRRAPVSSVRRWRQFASNVRRSFTSFLSWPPRVSRVCTRSLLISVSAASVCWRSVFNWLRSDVSKSPYSFLKAPTLRSKLLRSAFVESTLRLMASVNVCDFEFASVNAACSSSRSFASSASRAASAALRADCRPSTSVWSCSAAAQRAASVRSLAPRNPSANSDRNKADAWLTAADMVLLQPSAASLVAFSKRCAVRAIMSDSSTRSASSPPSCFSRASASLRVRSVAVVSSCLDDASTARRSASLTLWDNRLSMLVTSCRKSSSSVVEPARASVIALRNMATASSNDLSKALLAASKLALAPSKPSLVLVSSSATRRSA